MYALASDTDLPTSVARAWAAVRVSPARAREVLDTAQRYAVVAEHATNHGLAQALAYLEKNLNRFGFVRSDGDGRAWPLRFSTGMDSKASPALAHRALAHPCRAWGAITATALGWTASGGSGRNDNARAHGACPECVRLHTATGPWIDILSTLSQPFAMRHTPGSEIERRFESDIEGCAALLARGVARGTGDGSLRWWPCDESFPRPEETVPSHPRCTVCNRGRKAPTSQRPRTEADAWKALEKIAGRIGVWTGLIPTMEPYADRAIHDGEWGWTTNVIRGALTRSPGAESGLAGRRSIACGKGTSRGGAWASAVGEFVERECLRWREDAFATIRSSTNALRAAGVPHHRPDTLMQHSKQQLETRTEFRAKGYQHVRFGARFEQANQDDPIDWIAGVDLLSPAPHSLVLVPVSWVFIGAPPDRRGIDVHGDDRRFCLGDSNGCAAGPTWEDAAARAFCELLERDGFAMWWYNRIVRPGIDPRGLGSVWLDECPERFARAEREITLLDLTMYPDLPVVACVARNTSALRRRIGEDITVTSGCGPSVRIAAERAVAEQSQLGAQGSGRLASFYTWCRGPEYEAIDRWTTANEPWLAADPNARLRTSDDYPPDRTVRGEAFLGIVRSVARKVTTEMTAIDLTRPELELPVVKMAAPGLCHFWHRFGLKRLRETPWQKGWIDAPMDEHELNPVPVIL